MCIFHIDAFCVLIVFKQHLGKKICTIPFLFSSSYHPGLCRYPVRVEQPLLYFHVVIRPLKGNKMGQGVREWLDGGSSFRRARGRGRLSAGTLEQRPPAGSRGRGCVKVWGKEFSSRGSSKCKGGNEFGVSVEQREGQCGCTVLSLSSQGWRPLLLSFPKSNGIVPRVTRDGHVVECWCQLLFQGEADWLKEREGSWRSFPLHPQSWLHGRGLIHQMENRLSFGGFSILAITGLSSRDSLDASSRVYGVECTAWPVPSL